MITESKTKANRLIMHLMDVCEHQICSFITTSLRPCWGICCNEGKISRTLSFALQNERQNPKSQKGKIYYLEEMTYSLPQF